MSKSLPSRPNLEQLKKQAKDLLKEFRAQDRDAVERVRAVISEVGENLALHQAQLVVAREYGFGSWTKLKEAVELANANPPEALWAAIKGGEVARAREIFQAHPDLKKRINEPLPCGSFGATPLLAAAPLKNRAVIDLLLEQGADINGRSHWWAGSFGVLDGDHGRDWAEFLMERGAKLDAHSAARLGMLDRLKEFVARDPEVVQARGGDGQLPLHFASSIEIADFLLDHGAKVDAVDVDHESTAAQWMIRERTEIARHLVKRGCKTDLLMAAALGDLALAQKHLEAEPKCIGMSVSKEWFPMKHPHAGGSIYIWTLGHNKTPALVARDFGREEMFQFLMERSPEELKLAQACELGEEELFKRLLAKDPARIANLSERDRRKLVDAAQNNNTKAVRLMLEAGWPVDARGQHGGTVLHWACFHGNAEMAGIILRHNPPLELTDFDFKATPLGWAVHGSTNGWYVKTGNFAGVVEALLKAEASVSEKLREAEGSEAVMEILGKWRA